MDSYDLCVAEALLGRFRPAVVSMEINEKIPPPVYFRVLFDPEHVWAEDHFYGCSITAAAHHVKPRGYALESLQYNNAFFVRDDLAHGLVRDEDAEEAYDRGYRTRPDRRELFPWNHDVEEWQRASPVEVVERLHDRFAGYRGRFTAASRPPEGTVAVRAASPADRRAAAGRSGKGDGS